MHLIIWSAAVFCRNLTYVNLITPLHLFAVKRIVYPLIALINGSGLKTLTIHNPNEINQSSFLLVKKKEIFLKILFYVFLNQEPIHFRIFKIMKH